MNDFIFLLDGVELDGICAVAVVVAVAVAAAAASQSNCMHLYRLYRHTLFVAYNIKYK